MMSTVLWANYLVNGVVKSDETDMYALYKHLKKLDEICLSTSNQSFEKFCDSTDLIFNMGEEELPDGIESTEELMATKGNWIDAKDAVSVLNKALAHIQQNNTRFGLLKNAHADVVAELKESITYAETAANLNAKFNYSIVM
jgi:hypothetical protein